MDLVPFVTDLQLDTTRSADGHIIMPWSRGPAHEGMARFVDSRLWYCATNSAESSSASRRSHFVLFTSQLSNLFLMHPALPLEARDPREDPTNGRKMSSSPSGQPPKC